MRSSRIVFAALVVLAGSAARPAQANGCCTWRAIAAHSPSDYKSLSASGWCAMTWSWSWTFIGEAAHNSIFSMFDATGIHSYANDSAVCTGNGQFKIERSSACTSPVEDIEAFGRNEFHAEVHLNDSRSIMSLGEMRIDCTKITGRKGSFDCHAIGAVEATSEGEGDAESGVLEIKWGPAQVSLPVHWSTGGSKSAAFKSSDSGSGGTTPTYFNLTTTVAGEWNVGWGYVRDDGDGGISSSKSELVVYGTCDGTCRAREVSLHDVKGY